jgi:hypothetical protein
MYFKSLARSTNLFSLTALFLLVAIHPSNASEKLYIQASVGEHPFLENFEVGPNAFLGDQWIFNIEVLDSDGDPAEGAVVRIYDGKKSVGTGRVQSEGYAAVKVGWRKLGALNLIVVATDNDPVSKGQSTLQVNVLEPKTINALPKLWVEDEIFPEDNGYYLRPDLELIMRSGCSDITKYWVYQSPKVMKDLWNYPPMATWPFSSTKAKGAWYAHYTNESSFEEELKNQNSIAPRWEVHRDGSKTATTDPRRSMDLQLGSYALCTTSSGGLVIIK